MYYYLAVKWVTLLFYVVVVIELVMSGRDYGEI